MNTWFPEDTPRTNAVREASIALPWGSVVEIPKGHPPSDPWELAIELERENRIMFRALNNANDASYVSDSLVRQYIQEGLSDRRKLFNKYHKDDGDKEK